MPTLQQGIYKHYKGNLYQVIGVGLHTETQETLVFYKALYGEYRLFARPFAMFTETLTIEEHEVPRFKFIQKT